MKKSKTVKRAEPAYKKLASKTIFSELDGEEQDNMNPVIVKEWINKLRSGKFKQGVGNLCSVDPKGNFLYCCLGVLFETLIEKEFPVKKSDLPNDGSYGSATYEFKKERDACCLSEKVRESIGMTEDTMQTLIDKNDIGEKSFKQIATYIEKNLLKK